MKQLHEFRACRRGNDYERYLMEFTCSATLQRDLEDMKRELTKYPHRQYLKIKILNLTRELKALK